MGANRPRRGAGTSGFGLTGSDNAEQLPLIGPRGGLRPRPRARPKPHEQARETTPADGELLVARVLVDISLPHMDRLFDYEVPSELDCAAVVGSRVRVRLASRVHDGFVIERSPSPGHGQALRAIDSVVSSVPALSPDIAKLARSVADRFAGSMCDVVRLAVPPRHARVEQEWPELVPQADPSTAPPPNPGRLAAWNQYASAPAFAARVVAGQPVRAVWSCAPSERWTLGLAGLVTEVARSGGGVVVVVPDGTDVDDMVAALNIPPEWLSVLRADAGPSSRYREFLRILSGTVRVAVGPRAAAFAPVANLRLAAIWDDADPSHCEQRAPYPHAREVLVLRSQLTGCAFLLGGYHRTCEAQLLVATQWAHDVRGSAGRIRRARPVVDAADAGRSGPLDAARRIPAAVASTLREGLEVGPVLVVTSRRGYVPVTACGACRELASCARCGGMLAIIGVPDEGSDRPPTQCATCGSDGAAWSCPSCGGTALRSVRIGATRSAEELGRMFPGVPVVISTADRPTRHIPDRPAIVVATSGMEPLAENGYAAAAFLDARLDLRRPDLRASERALHRWLSSAALVRPGGKITVVADSDDPAVQAMIRWDPSGFALAELTRRADMWLPPVMRTVQFDGAEPDLKTVAQAFGEWPSTKIRGPRPMEAEATGAFAPESQSPFRLLVSSSRGEGIVAESRRLMVAMSSSRGGPVRVHVDPFVIE